MRVNKKGAIIGIVGTDTDSGKTVVTGGLLAALHELGVRAQGLKPVQSGCAVLPGGALQAPDVETWRQSCPEADCTALITLSDACSPHLAARRAGLRLSAGELAAQVFTAAKDAELVLLEGAGGLLTPLNDTETLADVFQKVCTAVLLVTANRLGAVNHSLLTLEALRARRISVVGFVLNEPTATVKADELHQAIQEDNAAIIARQGTVLCLGEVPYVSGLSEPGATDRPSRWGAITAALIPVARVIMNNYCGAQGEHPPAGKTRGAARLLAPEASAPKQGTR